MSVSVWLLLTEGCSSSLPSLSEDTKNWFQAVAWIATALGVIVAAIKLSTEVIESRKQRDRDLRWKQAEAGKNLNDEMQTDPKAWPALQMLDSVQREYLIGSDKCVTIALADITKALLETDSGDDSDREKLVYIRDCFDTLFYYLAILDHYIRSTLIRADDVAYPLEYYVPLMSKLAPAIVVYLDRYRLTRALNFLRRYPEWLKAENSIRDASASSPSELNGDR